MKATLIKALRHQGGLPASKARDVAGAVLDEMVSTLVRTGSVRTKGFGSLVVVTHKARAGRNPKTGEKVDVPSRRTVKFRPSNELVERLSA